MVRLHRVDDALRLAVAARELRRDRRVRALDLVGHRLAEVVEHRRPLRGLHARAELGRHDPGEVHDLERVLEHVLPVARAEPKPAENAHELLVERAAVRLEHRLLAGLAHDVLDLRLRLVVHLLDAGGMDAPVLDQLGQRQARDLAAQPVEGREHDRVRRVVDDEVDAGEMLERADVAALTADDPSLHVVGRQLDHGHGRLGGMARCDALERVGDEVPGAALRLRARLLLEHADAAREIVSHELLAALEQMRFGLLQAHARDALDLRLLDRLRLLQVLLELPEVDLAVGEPLVLALELDELPLDVLFLREDALLDLQDLRAAVGVLGVDVGAELDRLLTRLDLRLAPERLGLALARPRASWRWILRALPTLVAPKTCTASSTSAAPTTIPAATAIPMCTCDAPRSVGFNPIRHCARIADRRSRSVPGAPRSRAGGRPPYVAVGLPLDRLVSRALIRMRFRKNALCRQNVG